MPFCPPPNICKPSLNEQGRREPADNQMKLMRRRLIKKSLGNFQVQSKILLNKPQLGNLKFTIKQHYKNNFACTCLKDTSSASSWLNSECEKIYL